MSSLMFRRYAEGGTSPPVPSRPVTSPTPSMTTCPVPDTTTYEPTTRSSSPKFSSPRMSLTSSSPQPDMRLAHPGAAARATAAKSVRVNWGAIRGLPKRGSGLTGERYAPPRRPVEAARRSGASTGRDRAAAGRKTSASPTRQRGRGRSSPKVRAEPSLSAASKGSSRVLRGVRRRGGLADASGSQGASPLRTTRDDTRDFRTLQNGPKS